MDLSAIIDEFNRRKAQAGQSVNDLIQSQPVRNITDFFGGAQMQGQSFAQPQQQDVFSQAKQQYPILNKYDLQYKMSPNRGKGYLEFWPPGEGGAPDLPRPKEFNINKPGIEVYDPKTRPEDILGDAVSHHLVNVDPQLKADYANFEKSLTPQQQSKLQEQYQWAQKNEGERRPYQDWYKASGLPGFFRGYLFNQWENPERIYTPEQIKFFDGVRERLKQ